MDIKIVKGKNFSIDHESHYQVVITFIGLKKNVTQEQIANLTEDFEDFFEDFSLGYQAAIDRKIKLKAINGSVIALITYERYFGISKSAWKDIDTDTTSAKEQLEQMLSTFM